jgi:hypothetical protein
MPWNAVFEVIFKKHATNRSALPKTIMAGGVFTAADDLLMIY